MSIIDAYEPWLTLIGLRLVHERNTAPAPELGVTRLPRYSMRTAPT